MIHFQSLPGRVAYAEVREIQHGLVEKRLAGLIPDTLLFCEHLPIVTRGRGLQRIPDQQAKGPMPDPVLLPGVAFETTERGGDLTYHGPGQLVLYPIFLLDGSHALAPAKDIHVFLRGIEQVLISVLKKYGLQGSARSDATGVWVDDHKVASIGIAIRKWVTFHGAAINVNTDLKMFTGFQPCGFQSEVMTSLEKLLPEDQRWKSENWRSLLEADIQTEMLRLAAFSPNRDNALLGL